jgi:hypothetical protein
MRKIFLKGALFLSAAIVFNSCDKNNTSLDGAGNTIIKINHGGPDPILIPLDVNPLQEEVAILDVRRDAASSGALNTPTTITFTNTQAYLDSFNANNGTSYELLPTDAYTITPGSGITVSGDTWTINLAAGEFAREVAIQLDKTKMDLSKQYGFGFEITSATAGTVAKDNGEALVNVLIKNKYDGVYGLNITTVGWGAYGISDGPALDYPDDIGLGTTGESSVNLFNYGRQDHLQPAFTSAGDPTAFGATGPEFTFNASDQLIKVDNTVPDDGRGRDFVLAPLAGSNYFDPATKTFYAYYIMKQNGRPDQFITCIFTYKGPR